VPNLHGQAFFVAQGTKFIDPSWVGESTVLAWLVEIIDTIVEMMQGALLFEHILRLTALSPVVGKGTLRRTLKDIGVQPEQATPDDFRKSLGRLEARLLAYVSASEAEQRIASIQQFLDQHDPTFSG
jgi:hypothetical protein